MIKLIRIDYRLLHGQVIVSWLNSYNIGRIVIIDDNAYNDEITKKTLMMSKPTNTKLNIFSVEEALKRKNKISKLKENVALIFGNVPECYAFIREFPEKVEEINLGNIPKKNNSTKYDKTVYLTEQDVDFSRKLVNSGIRLYSQQVPNAKLTELNESF